MDQHEDLQELLTRLNNVRDSMEEALGYVRGIEDDYSASGGGGVRRIGRAAKKDK